MSKLSGYKKDIIIVISMMGIGLLLLIIVLLSQEEGATVTVQVDGKEVAAFPLDRDCTYEIEGVNGGTNHLVIKDGYAFIDEASCPDGLCKNMGKIHISTQSIICLPNKVVVGITGGEDDGVDVTIQ